MAQLTVTYRYVILIESNGGKLSLSHNSKSCHSDIENGGKRLMYVIKSTTQIIPTSQ